jgi:hypothetical protein
MYVGIGTQTVARALLRTDMVSALATRACIILTLMTAVKKDMCDRKRFSEADKTYMKFVPLANVYRRHLLREA